MKVATWIERLRSGTKAKVVDSMDQRWKISREKPTNDYMSYQAKIRTVLIFQWTIARQQLPSFKEEGSVANPTMYIYMSVWLELLLIKGIVIVTVLQVCEHLLPIIHFCDDAVDEIEFSGWYWPREKIGKRAVWYLCRSRRQTQRERLCMCQSLLYVTKVKSDNTNDQPTPWQLSISRLGYFACLLRTR